MKVSAVCFCILFFLDAGIAQNANFRIDSATANRLINEICRDSLVRCNCIGFSCAHPPKEYLQFDSLTNDMSLNEIVVLAKEKNLILKWYAIQKLSDMQYSYRPIYDCQGGVIVTTFPMSDSIEHEMYRLVKGSLCDTSRLSYQCGCSIFGEDITGMFFLDRYIEVLYTQDVNKYVKNKSPLSKRQKKELSAIVNSSGLSSRYRAYLIERID